VTWLGLWPSGRQHLSMCGSACLQDPVALAMAWLPARLPRKVDDGPAPETVLPREAYPDRASLAAAEATSDHGGLRADHPHYV
jgi:hypothetical protein